MTIAYAVGLPKPPLVSTDVVAAAAAGAANGEADSTDQGDGSVGTTTRQMTKRPDWFKWYQSRLGRLLRYTEVSEFQPDEIDSVVDGILKDDGWKKDKRGSIPIGKPGPNGAAIREC